MFKYFHCELNIRKVGFFQPFAFFLFCFDDYKYYFLHPEMVQMGVGEGMGGR